MNDAIRTDIERFIAAYPRDGIARTIWRPPLVGFASAADPLFDRLKSVVSPTHAVPTDLLEEAVTVVAFFIPFTKALATTNKKGKTASEAWARAYLRTNELIRDVCLHMKAFLEDRGFPTHVMPATHNFDPKKLISDWSHRHVAFIAGLGRFGVNNMLITEGGACGRLGTFVTAAPAEPDPRPTEEACLYRYDETCLQCVKRCVNDALQPDRFDRHRCYEMCLLNEDRFKTLGRADVCGKCVVAVPCSHKIPKKRKR